MESMMNWKPAQHPARFEGKEMVNSTHAFHAEYDGFQLRAQQSGDFKNTGYWCVKSGPTLLAGGDCLDLDTAKRKATEYVIRGKAAKRLKYLNS